MADLNTLAVECLPADGTVSLPRLPGLPDDAFTHDGQITKREVRAVTLAALAPLPGQLLWDVGAGCGSISIEWLRAGRGMRAIAIESEAKRCGIIRGNAATLGTPEIEIVNGTAPRRLRGWRGPMPSLSAVASQHRPRGALLGGAFARRPAGGQCRDGAGRGAAAAMPGGAWAAALPGSPFHGPSRSAASLAGAP